MSDDSTISERWLPVVGWEDLYLVSNLGRVQSLDRWVRRSHTRPFLKRGRVLRPKKNTHGYWCVTLCDGEQVTVAIHILVLRAFAGPPPLGMESLHGPNGKSDNRWPENLSWGTHSQNALDMQRDGVDPHRNKMRCPLDHVLRLPNLVASEQIKGHRACLACARTRAMQQKAEHSGRQFDFAEEASWQYAKIMGLPLPDVARPPKWHHPNSDKERCPLGHLLEAPNLVPSQLKKGKRACLACGRSHSAKWMAQKYGRQFDFQAEADQRYRNLMSL